MSINIKQISVSSLVRRANIGNLNFDTEYQRNFVWNDNQKKVFIESLFLEYDVPKIYFHPKEHSIYDVVDGQQRIKTIVEFTDNKFKTSEDTICLNENISKKLYEELDGKYKDLFDEIQLTVVYLEGFDDETIKDMFWRYQMGEPLNAAEKRRALPGDFVNVVEELSKSIFFELVDFNNKRYGYEDAVAKILQQRISGIKSITPSSLQRTYKLYEDRKTIKKEIKDVKSALQYINKGFNDSNSKEPNPKLKKWAVLTLVEIVCQLKESYAKIDPFFITNSFLNFRAIIRKNRELDEANQNPTLIAVNDAMRGDSPANQEYRYRMLYSHIIKSCSSNLIPLDPARLFSLIEKQTLLDISNYKCGRCDISVSIDSSEADHIIPYSKGGKTVLKNGQILCISCNRSKSNKLT